MIKSILSADNYYLSIHKAFHSLFGEDQMLHYPLYIKDGQSLIEGQRNFTDYCLSFMPISENSDILDVGCGNGVQSIYINQKYKPLHLTGVDINELNIDLAKKSSPENGCGNIHFFADNAQKLTSIKNESIDGLICIESAFHYPDKQEFIKQIKRVLKPDGYFLIADILFKKTGGPNKWEKAVQFNNWTYDQYKSAFDQMGFEIIKDEDFTNKVINGFQNAKNWFKKPSQKNKLSYLAGLLFARFITKIYLNELKSSHTYHLFVGKNRK